MTDNLLDALPETVKDALNQDTFDVLDFVTGDLTPKDSILIYTDREAGYELNQFVQREKEIAKRAEIEGLGIADDADWVDEDEVAAVRKRVEDSALTFHLKALAPALKKAIRQKLVATTNYVEGASFEENIEFFQQFTYELMARTIVKAVTATGKVDANWGDIEKIKKLEARLDESEFGRLDQKVFSINSDGDVYDAAVSADFLSKR